MPAAAARIRDAGLRVSNIVELGWWVLGQPSTWPAQQERLLDAIDAAVTIGAPCLVVTSGPAGRLGWDDAAQAFGAAVAPVREHAAASGVEIALEHTGPLRVDLSFVTTLRDALDVARAHDVGVCMEISSCFAERALAATVASAGPTLTHVQLSDYVVGSLSTPDRAVPGDGDIPLARIIRALADSGYDRAFELELVGPRIEAEGYASAITRGVAHLDEVLDART